MRSEAVWICVQCGYLNRCEVTQHSDEETHVREHTPYGCLHGMCKMDNHDEDKALWELSWSSE